MLQALRAPNEQPGTDEQYQCDGDLRDDERGAHVVADDAPRASSALAQLRLEIHACRAQGWRQTEQDTAGHSGKQGESEHDGVQSRLGEPG